MKLPYLILALLVLLLGLPLNVAHAATSAEVTITASPGNVSGECPSDFAITIVSPYEMQLSWTNGTGGNVTGAIVKAAYGRTPGNATDGFEVYNGNSTGTTHWVNTEFIGVDVYYKVWNTLVGGEYSSCYLEGLVAGGESVTNLASIFIFIAPAVVAALGMFGRRKHYPLTVAAGILWLALSIWFIANSTSAADLYNILGWVSIALGLAFVLSPLWLPRKEELDTPVVKEEIVEEKEEPYGDRLKKWEKDSGLRTRRRYAEE